MANLFIACLLWLFFGFFGVHHVYLGRERHAFVYVATLGGLCGLGWLRDLWCLPRYVAQSNGLWRTQQKAGLVRLVAMVVMGLKFGSLVTLLIPPKWFALGGALSLLVTSLAVSLGIHLVANIGRQQTRLIFPFLYACSLSCFSWYHKYPISLLMVSFITALTTWLLCITSKPYSYTPIRNQKSFRKRLWTLLKYGTVYWLLWGTALYFNGTVIDDHGREIPLRTVVREFLNSPEWEAIKRGMWHELDDFIMWWQELFRGKERTEDQSRERKQENPRDWEREGRRKPNDRDTEQKWERSREVPPRSSDPYQVLGVSRRASQKEITARYRRLVLLWHPDKETDPRLKTEAQAVFMQIQNAYEMLTKKR